MKHLERDRTVHRQMARSIDGAHSAFTKSSLDAVLLVKRLTDKWICEFGGSRHLFIYDEAEYLELFRNEVRFYSGLVFFTSIAGGGADAIVHHQVDLTILLDSGLGLQTICVRRPDECRKKWMGFERF